MPFKSGWFDIYASCVLSSFYDPDVGDRGLRRMQRKPRPSFEFVKQGVFQRQAERQRLTVSLSVLYRLAPPCL